MEEDTRFTYNARHVQHILDENSQRIRDYQQLLANKSKMDKAEFDRKMATLVAEFHGCTFLLAEIVKRQGNTGVYYKKSLKHYLPIDMHPSEAAKACIFNDEYKERRQKIVESVSHIDE